MFKSTHAIFVFVLNCSSRISLTLFLSINTYVQRFATFVLPFPVHPQAHGRSQTLISDQEEKIPLPRRRENQRLRKSRTKIKAKAMLESISTRKAVPTASLMMASRKSTAATRQSNKRVAPKPLINSSSSTRERKASRMLLSTRVVKKVATRMPIMARSRRRSLPSPTTTKRRTTRARSSARICTLCPHH